MKQIKLAQGKLVIVDDEKYEYVNQWTWSFSMGYAKRREKLGQNKFHTIQMHRVLMDCPKNMQVDHIDGNGLNNQKNNLRICSPLQNMRNQKVRKNNSSGYRGVHWSIKHNKWIARIGSNYMRIHLGCFDDKREAAEAFNNASKKYHGEFGRLNKI